MVCHHGAHRRRHPGDAAGVEPVVAGEGRGVGHAFEIDRRTGRFGQRREFGMGVRSGHGVASKNDRRPAGANHRGGLGDGVGVAAQAGADARRGKHVEVGRRDGRQDVAGDRQEHRAGWRRQRDLGGAADGAGKFGQRCDLERPFAQRARHRRQIVPEQRLGEADAHVLLARGHQDRRAGLCRIVQHSHGVAEAGGGVEAADRKPARRLGIAIGHAEDDDLVESEDIADAGFNDESIHQRQFGGAGVAENQRDAFRRQQVEEDVLPDLACGRSNPGLAGFTRAHPIGSVTTTGGSRKLPSSSSALGR